MAELIVTEKTYVNLGEVQDVVPVLRALADVGATLFLEGTSTHKAVAAGLSGYEVDPTTPLDLSGTPWPIPTARHLALTGELVGFLASSLERHASPEVFDHLVVYRDAEVLLAAYDAGQDDVWVSRQLDGRILASVRAAADSG